MSSGSGDTTFAAVQNATSNSKSRNSFIGADGKMKASISKAEKKARRDKYLAQQNKMSSDDYVKLKEAMENEFKQAAIEKSAKKNGWSVDEEREWNRLLKEEEKEKQQESALLKKKQEEVQEKEELEKRDERSAEQLRKELASQAYAGSFDGKQVFNSEGKSILQNYDNNPFQAQEELAQKKREQDEEISQANADLQQRIAELKAQEEEELAAEDGDKPLPFLVALFANPLFLLLMTVIDSAVALIPVGGDFIGLAISAAVWAIPCVLMWSMGAYVNIWKFFLFDLIFGLVAGSLGNVAPGIGDALLDAVPEALLFLSMLFGRNEK